MLACVCVCVCVCVCACACVCVCVCVCRQREREREREREITRAGERERESERDKRAEREIESSYGAWPEFSGIHTLSPMCTFSGMRVQCQTVTIAGLVHPTHGKVTAVSKETYNRGRVTAALTAV